MTTRYPTPTRKDHERFCAVEGWTHRATARGKTGTHHANYELLLPDGNVLWTRISHPINRTDYGRGMWKAMLRDQLQVSEEAFWACVDRGTKPDRGGRAEPKADSIPVGVASALIQVFNVPEAEVRAMTRGEAIRRLSECYTQQT